MTLREPTLDYQLRESTLVDAIKTTQHKFHMQQIVNRSTNVQSVYFLFIKSYIKREHSTNCAYINGSENNIVSAVLVVMNIAGQFGVLVLDHRSNRVTPTNLKYTRASEWMIWLG